MKRRRHALLLAALGALPDGEGGAPLPPEGGAGAPPADADGGADGDGDGDGAPTVGPNGFPERTAWRDMTPEHQAAYWRHQAQVNDRRRKAVESETAGLRERAAQFDALAEASKSEAERERDAAVARAEAAEAAVQQARRDAVAADVRSRLAAAAPGKGLTAEALASLAGPAARFLADDGAVDEDAIGDFLAALPDRKDASPLSPGSLGGGKRQSAAPSGLAAGAAAYAAKHARKQPSA